MGLVMAGSLLETTIGEVCEVFDGPHATPTRLDAGPVFLGITSLNKGRIDLAASDHVSEEDFAKWTRRVTPRPGDVVFSYETKLGEAAIIPEGLRCCLGRRMGLMRPDSKRLDSRFLLYYYLGPEFQDVIRERTIRGSTVERLALTEFPRFPIRIPPLPEQRAIASVLGALDDKIDLNRRMCQTLEEMARALFKSWFVDFDPVRAKMEGRDPGLPKEIADLFPSRLVDSELGPIPEGWRAAPLRDEFEAAKGLSYKGSGLSDSGVPLHNLNSIFEGGGYKHSGIKWYRGEYADRHLINGGDVIVANTEQGHDRLLIGFAARVPNDYDGLGLFSHHLYRVRAALGSQLTGNWIYRLLNTRAMHETVSGYANGTTVNMLPIDGLQSPRFVVPAGEIVATFDRQDEDWQARGALAMRETRTLAALRDTLLPKLISGELRVPASLGSMQEVAP